MKAIVVWAGAILLVSAGWAWAQDSEQMAMALVRLSTDPAIAMGCHQVGRTRDDSVKDLRRKILRFGGNTAVISFGGISEMSTIYADVFRCSPPTATSPPNAPPPTPGTPPPAPPGATR